MQKNSKKQKPEEAAKPLVSLNNILTAEDRQRNEAKYGNQQDDVIARTYREDKLFGDIYCAKNAEKYLRRFLSRSVKGNNPMDVKKALDYITRMAEMNPITEATSEVIEK